MHPHHVGHEDLSVADGELLAVSKCFGGLLVVSGLSLGVHFAELAAERLGFLWIVLDAFKQLRLSSTDSRYH